MRRLAAAALCSALASGCASSGSPVADYVEDLNAMTDEYAAVGEALQAEFPTSREPTMDDIRTLMDANADLWIAVAADYEDLEPPREIAELHDGMAAWVSMSSQRVDPSCQTDSTWVCRGRDSPSASCSIR